MTNFRNTHTQQQKKKTILFIPNHTHTQQQIGNTYLKPQAVRVFLSATPCFAFPGLYAQAYEHAASLVPEL